MEDYKTSLNLPKTDFPMKAELAKREPEISKVWEEKEIYQKIRNRALNKDTFILHDGPPYANGNIHLGTAFNKILKDIIVRFFSMNGFDAPYVPGWDCHGLPIEHQVLKNLGKSKEELDILEIRNKCKFYAQKFIQIQREEFERLGIFAYWDKPYLTMDFAYESNIIKCFQMMASGGYIYRGNKPIYWCSTCETALAEAEVEYQDHTSPSVYVAFNLPANELKKVIPSQNHDTSIIIWTTTPWTLPANVAIAVHPDATYVVVENSDKNETFIVAQKLLTNCLQKFSIKNHSILAEIKGKDLEGLKANHPFIERDSVVVLAPYVELETGTGCVHTAPGHGQEDYETGLKYDLPILSPVDSKGRFTDEVPLFQGKKVFEANNFIIEELKNRNKLLATESITHSYPHCWRCKNPVIFRATPQWFVSLDNEKELRKKSLENINSVEWIPNWGIDRISNMIKDRPDWCISRQRAWGVAIPAIYCEKCKRPLLDNNFIERVRILTEQEGSDIWFKKSIKEIYDGELTCKCGCHDFYKENDILDVWFDSGASHEAVLKNKKRYGLSWPADLYLEGTDQHRGWFHSSMLISTATNNASPYKSVLTHGFVVDGSGRKMSKSLGNVIAPQEIIKKFGSDLLRLWVASENYREDVRISDVILTRISEAYRKIRNTSRFILANLYDFDPEKDALPYENLKGLDKWALFKLEEFRRHSILAFEKFEFHSFYHAMQNFCTTEMSSTYLDIIKDRLYIEPPKSRERRSTQTALYLIIKSLAQLMAPVLPYTAEDIWQYIPKNKDMEESVHLTIFPHAEEKYILSETERKRWETLFIAKENINIALEPLRKNKVIAHSLDSQIKLQVANDDLINLFNSFDDRLCDIFIVSKVLVEKISSDTFSDKEKELGYRTIAEKATGDKCKRCWKYDDELGLDKTHATLCPRCANIMKVI